MPIEPFILLNFQASFRAVTMSAQMMVQLPVKTWSTHILRMAQSIIQSATVNIITQEINAKQVCHL